MEHVKEIRKIESPIKEIKKEKKIESLDDEFIEEEEVSVSNGFRRSNKTSTLSTIDTPQEKAIRERKISKEDQEEINFRPSYLPGNGNKDNVYTPVGSAESAANRGSTQLKNNLGFADGRELQSPNPQADSRDTGQSESARAYVGEEEGDQRRRRRSM